MLHLGAGVPVDALAAVAQLVHEWAQRGKALVGVGVVALHHRDLGRRLARDEVTLALFPLGHAVGLRQLGGRVVHQWREHGIALHAQMTHADLTEGLGKALVDFPIRTRFPHRIDRSRQRVNEGMHVAGVEIVFLVPARRRQHHV
ncbi:hypothetical protein D3C72_1745010 [compost metagenome]